MSSEAAGAVDEIPISPSETPQAHRYPLAWDERGEPLALPSHAAWWRVEKLRERRAVRGLVEFRNGAPLMIDVEGDATDMQRPRTDKPPGAGLGPGVYRLTACDADGRTIPGFVSIVELHPTETALQVTAAPVPDAATAAMALNLTEAIGALKSSHLALIEASTQVQLKNAATQEKFIDALVQRINPSMVPRATTAEATVDSEVGVMRQMIGGVVELAKEPLKMLTGAVLLKKAADEAEKKQQQQQPTDENPEPEHLQ